MSPKDSRLQIRISDDLEMEIAEVEELFEKQTGVKTTRTSIIESALKEGLKIIKDRLESKK